MLSLLALFALGMAQPLLDLLGRNAEFLIAHDLGAAETVALAVGVAFGIPLVSAAAVVIVGRLHHGAGVVLHLVLLGAFAAMVVLALTRTSGASSALPGVAWLVIALVAAAGTAVLYVRSATARRVIAVAALAAPAAVVVFLFATPARGLVLPGPEADVEVEVGPDAKDDLPPIVFVMFDEFPVASLLDRQGRIDEEQYPSFARLANHSTFLRNTSTTSSTTVDAVPAALSGQYSHPDELPTARDHPTNLLALLQDHYTVRAVQPLSDLCTTPCGALAGAAADSDTSKSELLSDLRVVASHLVVPEDMAHVLPAVDSGWKGFGQAGHRGAGDPADDGRDPTDDGRVLTPREKREIMRQRLHGTLTTGQPPPSPPENFVSFAEGIRSTDRPTLDFLHVLMPHQPWVYLPDGRRHTARQPRRLWDEPALFAGQWVDRDWPVAQAYQMHLAQLAFTDRLLGRLLDNLESEGLFDRALVVVTADHGASFTPGTAARGFTPATFGDVAAVPLFIKAPGQSSPAVSDQPVESVDILPSVLDLLAVEPPPGLAGRSVFDTGAAPRRYRQAFGLDGTRAKIPTEALWDSAVDHKYDLFAPAGAAFDLYGLAPPGMADLLGRPVPQATDAGGSMRINLIAPEAFEDVDLDSDTVPSVIWGRVEGLRGNMERPTLAVVLNGRIAAVTVADTGHGVAGEFRALVPPELLIEGRNELRILLVEPSFSDLPLAP